MAKNYGLFETVIKESTDDSWSSAVLEWEIYDAEEDVDMNSKCICGKEGLRYLYTIRNVHNDNILHPIGSQCIKKFERSEFNDQINVNEGLFSLMHAIENEEFIELNSDYFSRKLLKYLYEEGVFQNFRDNTARGEYEFMLNMFNKRNEPSKAQKGKIRAIIMNDIRPYLNEKLEGKTIKNY